MTTLTAQANRTTGTVRLTVSGAAAVTGIMRADHNGTRLVRVRADQRGTRAGSFTITDYEPSLSGLIQYQVIEADAEVVPAWTTLAPTELPTFVLPSIPQFSVTVENVHAYSSERRSRSTFHEIIDRFDPIVAEARLGSRSGSMDIFCAEYMDGKNLENLLERGQVAMYRQVEHPGMDMYFHINGAVSIEPDEGAWKLKVDYREVSFPRGDVLSGANWTFDRLAATVADFHAVAQDYGSFHDVTIGEKL